MKVTNAEVKTAIERYLGQKFSGEIVCGVEADGDMVVLCDPDGTWGQRTASAFSQAVMSLARKHGEAYTPYIVNLQQLSAYKADSGFKEVEDPPVPWWDKKWEFIISGEIIQIYSDPIPTEGYLLCTAYSLVMAQRIMGMQKLVKAARGLVDEADSNSVEVRLAQRVEIKVALLEMGENV